MKKNSVLALMMILMSSMVSSANFISVTPNQNSYENGDILIFTIRMDDPNVQLTMDASVLDPYFRPQDTIIRQVPQNSTFIIIHPLSFLNNLPDGTYPILFNAYNPVTKASDALTYNVRRVSSGIIEDNADSGSLIVKVRPQGTPEDIPDVSPGTVKVCFPEGDCIDQSSQWYADAITPVPNYQKNINDQLSGLNRKLDDTNAISGQNLIFIQGYINESSGHLSDSITRFDNTVQTFGAVMTNQTKQTQNMLRYASYISVGGILSVFLFMIIILYLLYLRHATSWFYW